jgi:hypothetical protein
MTDQEKQEKLKKRREAYHQKKQTEKKCPKVTDQKRRQKLQNKCVRERERYADMQQDQKKVKVEQVAANRALRHDTLGKNSIAMENPAYIASDNSEKIKSRPMEKIDAPPDEDYSMDIKVIDDPESPKQPTEMKEGDTLNCRYDSQ